MLDPIRKYNRDSWDLKVNNGNMWTVPVSKEIIEQARRGRWQIVLTPEKPVPFEWFPDLNGSSVLCLAGAGGQQAPVLAAAGATVTVFDNSPRQLEQDRFVAERDGLDLETIEGDMRDLSIFADATFDLIIQPVANCFIPDTQPLWEESYRVLKSGGSMLTGMANPVIYIFDQDLLDRETFKVRHTIPYSDLKSLSDEELEKHKEQKYSLEFGHTLEDLIGGQIQAGFMITGFYEDTWDMDPVSKFLPTFFATKSLKPVSGV